MAVSPHLNHSANWASSRRQVFFNEQPARGFNGIHFLQRITSWSRCMVHNVQSCLTVLMWSMWDYGTYLQTISEMKFPRIHFKSLTEEDTLDSDIYLFSSMNNSASSSVEKFLFTFRFIIRFHIMPKNFSNLVRIHFAHRSEIHQYQNWLKYFTSFVWQLVKPVIIDYMTISRQWIPELFFLVKNILHKELHENTIQ